MHWSDLLGGDKSDKDKQINEQGTHCERKSEGRRRVMTNFASRA